jgi:hypothetical protein
MTDKNGYEIKVGDYVRIKYTYIKNYSYKIKKVVDIEYVHGEKIVWVIEGNRKTYLAKYQNINDNFSTIRENWEYISPDDALIYKFSE